MFADELRGQKVFEKAYMGTLLKRIRLPVGTYSRTILGPYGGPKGERRFLRSEVPL